jgi:methylenetetrahydrofolate dehydrogenase (NADP+)/methenyltetrahydrofolate cyclohydrolase
MSDTNIILPSKPRVVSEDATKGTYEIDNLYPGYGHTLGNSLRRIILSSLPGAAITSLKIEGVPHEFSTIEGVKEADILVAAIGQPRFIKANMVKEGAAVMDVGINRAPEGGLCGDVDFEAVKAKASAITPVPGGLGPMTVAMLLHNTLSLANKRMSSSK